MPILIKSGFEDTEWQILGTGQGKLAEYYGDGQEVQSKWGTFNLQIRGQFTTYADKAILAYMLAMGDREIHVRHLNIHAGYFAAAGGTASPMFSLQRIKTTSPKTGGSGVGHSIIPNGETEATTWLGETTTSTGMTFADFRLSGAMAVFRATQALDSTSAYDLEWPPNDMILYSGEGIGLVGTGAGVTTLAVGGFIQWEEF